MAIECSLLSKCHRGECLPVVSGRYLFVLLAVCQLMAAPEQVAGPALPLALCELLADPGCTESRLC